MNQYFVMDDKGGAFLLLEEPKEYRSIRTIEAKDWKSAMEILYQQEGWGPFNPNREF